MIRWMAGQGCINGTTNAHDNDDSDHSINEVHQYYNLQHCNIMAATRWRIMIAPEIIVVALVIAALALVGNFSSRNHILKKMTTMSVEATNEHDNQQSAGEVDPLPTSRSKTPVTVLCSDSPPLVPFVTFHPPQWKLLDKLLQDYQAECHLTLEKLSQSLEMATLLDQQQQQQQQREVNRKTPRKFSLVAQIEERIQRLSSLYEEQERVLQQLLLRPFANIMALPSNDTPQGSESRQELRNPTRIPPQDNTGSVVRSRTGMAHINATYLMLDNEHDDDDDDDNNDNPKDHGASLNSNNKNAPASYDSALQILAHLVRDWSEFGAPVRRNLYDWCRQALRDHCPQYDQHDHHHLAILVPGAGMGRLAFDLATMDGHHVQALEVSVGMAAAASSLFHHSSSSSSLAIPFSLYPYAHDGFQNQVRAADRYVSVKVPDVANLTLKLQESFVERGGSLSYTVAAFEDLFRVPSSYGGGGGGVFDVIVTCFFLDTATNLWQYLDIIDHVLCLKQHDSYSTNCRGPGLWINVGPLQWHSNALLPTMTADELRQVLEDRDYEILHWSVDEEPMEYRNPTSGTGGRSSTAYNGYCPLRFVVQKKT